MIRNSDETLRGLEREVAASLASAFVPETLAQRYGDECRRRGLEWTPFLDVTARDAVRSYLRGRDDPAGERAAARWVRFVTDAGLSARPVIEAALAGVNRRVGATRLSVKTGDVYFLLMPYWDYLSSPPAAEVVATWASGLDTRGRALRSSGVISRETGTPPSWPYRRGVHPCAWTALTGDPPPGSRSVVIGLGVMTPYPPGGRDDVPAPVEEASPLVRDALWTIRSRGTPVGVRHGWDTLSRTELPLGKAVHFIIDEELRLYRPEAFEGLAIGRRLETPEQVNGALSALLAAANGRRRSATLTIDDLKEATRRSLACGVVAICAVATVGGTTAGHALLTLSLRQASDPQSWQLSERLETSSSFVSAMAEIGRDVPRRSRGGMRITLAFVVADGEEITIAVKATTGRILGWGAPGAVGHVAWPDIGYLRPESVHRWAIAPEPDRIRIPRDVAQAWSRSR